MPGRAQAYCTCKTQNKQKKKFLSTLTDLSTTNLPSQHQTPLHRKKKKKSAPRPKVDNRTQAGGDHCRQEEEEEKEESS